MEQILSKASEATANAIYWVERNGKVASDLEEQKQDIIFNLARTSTRLQSSAYNLKQRPTIGLFGASQAGKSYLVSSLAAGRNSRLTTHWDATPIDFIRHINPSGNNSEATGFVTRFTHVKHRTPEGFPVELTVLNELELVMILVNAFFNDINQSDVKMPSDENYFLQHLDSCEQYVDRAARAEALKFHEVDTTVVGGVEGKADGEGMMRDGFSVAGRLLSESGEYNYLTIPQVVELADFVAANSNGKLGSINEFPNFWQRLRDMLPYMPLDGRIETLSVLWQKLPIFNETYRILAKELLKIQGAHVLYAPMASFVSERNGELMQNESGTIMHITKLATMFADDTELKCAFIDADNQLQMTKINVSRLASLSLELRFTLESSGNLDEFDVLDLPGARSRDVVLLKDVVDDGAAFDGKTITPAMQLRGSEFFRRGKVAFLFDRYARKSEIEQLLFCIGVNAQQDVTSVLTILSDWVEQNVGSTPNQRATGYNPLTIVLTRYDEVFNRQLKNMNSGLPLDMNQELNIALNRIQKLNWFNEWTPGKPFDRVLLARKPNLGELNPWIEFEPATNRELSISEENQNKLAEIKQRLLEVQDFTMHVHDFAKCLESVLSLNDGGVTKIAEAIRANSLNDKRRNSLRTYKACHAVQECISLLSPFATRDGGLALEKSKKDGLELSLQLMQCNVFAPCFYLFRPLLEIPEQRLEEIYQQGFAMGSNVTRFVKAVIAEYMSKLSELMRKDQVQLNAIGELVSRSYANWKSNLEADPNNATAFSICYNQQERRFKSPEELKEDVVGLFNRIVNEISKTFGSSQVGMQKYMIKRLLEQENVNEGFVDIVRIQVQLMSYMLSDFNIYLGSNLLPSTSALATMQEQASKAKSQVQGNAKSLQAKAQAAPVTPQYGAGPQYGGAMGGMGGMGGGFGRFATNNAGDDEDFSDLALDNIGSGYGATAPAPNTPSKAASVETGGGTVDNSTSFLSPEQSVLGTSEGPCNSFYHVQEKVIYDPQRKDYDLFNFKCELDDTQLLPHLNAASADYEFKFISDFCAIMMYMMCRINVLQDSKYQFSSQENLLLCNLLSSMEQCEACQA